MKRILFCLLAISMCVVMTTSCCCCDDSNVSSSSDSETDIGNAFQKGFKYGWLCESARQEYNKGNYDKAISSYEEAITIDSEDKDAYVGLGQIYLTQKNYDEAVKNFKKALEIAPNAENIKSLLAEAEKGANSQ